MNTVSRAILAVAARQAGPAAGSAEVTIVLKEMRPNVTIGTARFAIRTTTTRLIE
jgi:hypothetical protein